MKITLDQDTLAKAVIAHLRSVGVQSDIREVEFRYTRVPYTVFAEVELVEVAAAKPARPAPVVELSAATAAEIPSPPLIPLLDPDTLPPVEEATPDEPPPSSPAAPLFGGG